MKTHALIITLAAMFAADANDVASLSEEGWKLWQAGKPVAALPKFREAAKLVPSDPEVWNGLGWAAFNSGLTEDGEQAFKRCLALSAGHPAALNGLGQIYLSKREYAKAEAQLLDAAERGASAAWHGLARLYLIQGKFADAEKWAQMLDDSGQGHAFSTKLLDAAKARKLDASLRAMIEPPTPPTLGIALAEKDGLTVIGSVVPKSPAAEDGRLKGGDVIVKIGDAEDSMTATAGRTVAECVKAMRGEEGTKIFLIVIPVGKTDGEAMKVTLTRKIVW